MKKFLFYLYINTYSNLLTFLGILILVVPLFKISFFFLIPQIFIALCLFAAASPIYASYPQKVRSYKLLVAKNRKTFKEDSFVIYMKAPCGRLITRAVLKEVGLKEKYKELKKYKPTIIETIKKGCEKPQAKVYINEEAYRKYVK